MYLMVFLFALLSSQLELECVSHFPGEENGSGFKWIDRSMKSKDNRVRLTRFVRPSLYEISLDVFLNTSQFDGVVKITVDILKANLLQIILHQNVAFVNNVTIYQGSTLITLHRMPFELDTQKQLLKINLGNYIYEGEYDIVITYGGVISDNVLDKGFYKGYYYYNNEKREYATTLLEPNFARNVFPCFDEPHLKARFILSVTRDKNLNPTYSNMLMGSIIQEESGRIRETFLQTPVMSPYLLAFHVSDFVETTITSSSAKPFKIISRPGVTDQHAWAAEIGLKITNNLEQYFDIPYYTMGQGQPMKNDHIALPDFPSGAMENWGMISYREYYLLYDINHSNLLHKIQVAKVMAHELAHQWFGNLVTCFWWSNVWLNESFAKFFEFFITHTTDRSLELDKQFVVESVHNALTSDASSSASTMNLSSASSHVSIKSHFSITSYDKGASVLRMIEHLIGEETFKIALHKYLKANSYGSGTPGALYDALRLAVSANSNFDSDYPNVDIGKVLDSWVQNLGSPVINVSINVKTGDAILTQERFQLKGLSKSGIWHIPLTWTSQDNLDFRDLKPKKIMYSEKVIIPKIRTGHNWVIFNIARSGLYRVNYDENSWRLIASELRADRNVIDELTRASIANDVLFFIRARKMNITRGFDVLSFLENESSYYVWKSVLTDIDWIRQRMEQLPTVHEAFNEYMLKMLKKVIKSVGYEESARDLTSIILNRMQILDYACKLDHDGCINSSKAKWKDFRQNNKSVHVNARHYVYCTGLRFGDATDYHFLFAKYNSSQNAADMNVMLRALGCSSDQDCIKHFFYQSMYNDKIRKHEKFNAFTYALQGNRKNLHIVISFLFENFEDIAIWYGGEEKLKAAILVLKSYLTNINYAFEVSDWLDDERLKLGEAVFSFGKAVVLSSIENQEWASSTSEEIIYSLQQNYSSASKKMPFLFVLYSFIAYLLL